MSEWRVVAEFEHGWDGPRYSLKDVIHKSPNSGMSMFVSHHDEGAWSVADLKAMHAAKMTAFDKPILYHRFEERLEEAK